MKNLRVAKIGSAPILNLLLFSNHHLTHPTKASGNVSSIAQDVEGDREEKQSRQFQPKFAQMPLICRVRPKTDSTNGGRSALITKLVHQSLTLLLPFCVSVFVKETKNSVFKPGNEDTVSMSIIQACSSSLPSTTALTNTPESDVGCRQFRFTLLHYLLAFVFALISDHARVKTSSSSSPSYADQSHNALSHLSSSFITSQAIIPSLLFVAVLHLLSFLSFSAVWDDAVQSQTFLDLNAAVSYDGQHTKIFRTCYSFFEQNRHSAVADRRDKTDEPQVKGREELGAVQILDQRVKETLHMEIVKRGCKLEKVRKQNEEKD
ncbi:hypothetical protein BLNAU_15903 [Blattamonas nauphoetae]|uniref:Uncharacterized protein n=1 Tax=Blattamonas nauphoetae TaxID=2049346 RepID=A0ABQ9X9F6_9EUKA|nr:hypothetical protein BLNAU_15903 [Blattamonas nauphoetae]